MKKLLIVSVLALAGCDNLSNLAEATYMLRTICEKSAQKGFQQVHSNNFYKLTIICEKVSGAEQVTIPLTRPEN